MGSSRRKIGNASKVEQLADVSSVDKLVQKHIEDRNFLIFGLCNHDLVQIKELMTWSVEGLYQILLMNHVKVQKEKNAQKTAKEETKFKNKLRK